MRMKGRSCVHPGPGSVLSAKSDGAWFTILLDKSSTLAACSIERREMESS